MKTELYVQPSFWPAVQDRHSDLPQRPPEIIPSSPSSLFLSVSTENIAPAQVLSHYKIFLSIWLTKSLNWLKLIFYPKFQTESPYPLHHMVSHLKSPLVSSDVLANISKMWLSMGIDHCSSFLPKTIGCYRYLQKFITSAFEYYSTWITGPRPKPSFINTGTLNIQTDDLSDALTSWLIGLLSYDGLVLHPTPTTNSLGCIWDLGMITYNILSIIPISSITSTHHLPSFQFTLFGTLLHPVIALCPLIIF